MKLSSTALDNSNGITPVNTDIERIQGGCRDRLEVWANVIEAGLASWLLEREIGPAFLAPIIVVCYDYPDNNCANTSTFVTPP